MMKNTLIVVLSILLFAVFCQVYLKLDYIPPISKWSSEQTVNGLCLNSDGQASSTERAIMRFKTGAYRYHCDIEIYKGGIGAFRGGYFYKDGQNSPYATTTTLQFQTIY